MTLDVRHPDEFLRMVDYEKGLVDRRMFADRDIYELELERIFARAWNFMCHDSQIPNPGDFFMTFIGEDRVIVVRDNEGLPQVLVNSCRHRGNAVCRAEEGHATSFMCTYHGWTYDLKGALVGVPGFKEVYHEELAREEWGLIKAAQVSTYKGFVFATMDGEAPPLDEYLGAVGKLSLNMVAEKGDQIVCVGGVQKNIIPCNWKFAADNVWDFYHGLSHLSALMAGWQGRNQRNPNFPLNMPNMAFLGEYGHVYAGPEHGSQNVTARFRDQEWRARPEAAKVFGPLVDRLPLNHPHVFPNFWVTSPGLAQVSLRLPKGPSQTEIWWFTFVDAAKPDAQNAQRQQAMHMFGPAGLFEQDDGENWGQSTRGMTGSVSQKYPINYSMNLGRGEVIRDELSPPRIETIGTTEHPQLWHYRAWAEWMSATDWEDLRRNHSRVPDRV